MLQDSSTRLHLLLRSPSKDTRQYHVALLPPDASNPLEQRTLNDAFPKFKTGRKGGR